MHRFGEFEMQIDKHRLLCRGEPVPVGGRAFDVLFALWERRARVVSKTELMCLVWPDVVVEENNLQVQVSSLRKILGARAILTVPGRGYQFAATTGFAAPVPALGPDPGPALAALSVVLPAPAMRSPLPKPLPLMHGREDDLCALVALTDQHPLVTVIGAGGMGKTLLAQHVLQAGHAAHPDGVCWVELAHLASPGLVIATLTAALGVDPGPGDPLRGLSAAIAPLRLLVALDNAEHLLAEVAAVAKAVLGAAPGVHLLVTTQAPLLLADERVYRVGPLAVPESPLSAADALGFSAIALFVERARSVDARFVFNDRLAHDVTLLCRQLDGLPLAIELAAARAPLLGVQGLTDLLQDRLRLLNSSRNRDAPARQQTLHAAMEWSHGLLAGRERAVFRRLAVFSGGAPLGAIQRVVSDASGSLDTWAAMDALGILVDRSLVTVLATGDEAAPRYRLLHSTRAYALERLRQAGEVDTVCRRHALALADQFDAAKAAALIAHRGREAWSASLACDIDNARDALAWARDAGEAGLERRLATGLLNALPRALYQERRALAERAGALSPPPGTAEPPWE